MIFLRSRNHLLKSFCWEGIWCLKFWDVPRYHGMQESWLQWLYKSIQWSSLNYIILYYTELYYIILHYITNPNDIRFCRKSLKYSPENRSHWITEARNLGCFPLSLRADGRAPIFSSSDTSVASFHGKNGGSEQELRGKKYIKITHLQNGSCSITVNLKSIILMYNRKIYTYIKSTYINVQTNIY